MELDGSATNPKLDVNHDNFFGQGVFEDVYDCLLILPADSNIAEIWCLAVSEAGVDERKEELQLKAFRDLSRLLGRALAQASVPATRASKRR